MLHPRPLRNRAGMYLPAWSAGTGVGARSSKASSLRTSCPRGPSTATLACLASKRYTGVVTVSLSVSLCEPREPNRRQWREGGELSRCSQISVSGLCCLPTDATLANAPRVISSASNSSNNYPRVSNIATENEASNVWLPENICQFVYCSMYLRVSTEA